MSFMSLVGPVDSLTSRNFSHICLEEVQVWISCVCPGSMSSMMVAMTFRSIISQALSLRASLCVISPDTYSHISARTRTRSTPLLGFATLHSYHVTHDRREPWALKANRRRCQLCPALGHGGLPAYLKCGDRCHQPTFQHGKSENFSR